MLSVSEKYLIESIRNGDQKAFEFLFKNYYSDLCKYARNIVQIEAVAEDLVMDVFAKMWESEGKLVIKSSVPGYLFTSVHNHCLNYLTRKHKRFTELDSATIEKLNSLVPPADSSDPLNSINIAELGNRIEQSMELLPEECRKIFLMSRTEGLPNKTIASKLGISENTVKVQIYRALKKLRILLGDYLPLSKLL
jgi:RNA polymerase sigma-70 factor (ECF subfamily)